MTSLGDKGFQTFLSKRVKIVKLKLLGSIQQIITEFTLFYQKWFFLIFPLNDIFQLQVFFKKLHIYKIRQPDFLKTHI